MRTNSRFLNVCLIDGWILLIEEAYRETAVNHGDELINSYRAIAIAHRFILHVTTLPRGTPVSYRLHAHRIICDCFLISARAVNELADTILLELHGPQPQQGSGMAARGHRERQDLGEVERTGKYFRTSFHHRWRIHCNSNFEPWTRKQTSIWSEVREDHNVYGNGNLIPLKASIKNRSRRGTEKTRSDLLAQRRSEPTPQASWGSLSTSPSSSPLFNATLHSFTASAISTHCSRERETLKVVDKSLPVWGFLGGSIASLSLFDPTVGLDSFFFISSNYYRNLYVNYNYHLNFTLSNFTIHDHDSIGKKKSWMKPTRLDQFFYYYTWVFISLE